MEKLISEKIHKMLSEGVEIYRPPEWIGEAFRIGKILVIKRLNDSKLIFGEDYKSYTVIPDREWVIEIDGLRVSDVCNEFVKRQYILLNRQYKDISNDIELKKQQENNEKILQILNKI